MYILLDHVILEGPLKGKQNRRKGRLDYVTTGVGGEGATWERSWGPGVSDVVGRPIADDMRRSPLSSRHVMMLQYALQRGRP